MKSFFFTPIIFVALVFISCESRPSKFVAESNNNDSITSWIKSSYNKDFSSTKKLQKLQKAYKGIKLLPKDSIKVSQLSQVAYRFYQLNDTLSFFEANDQVLKLAFKKKDSFVIADAHWSYAEYYMVNEKYDQAFYHYNQSYEGFNQLNKKLLASRMLYSMSFIKGRYRDYSGSEVLIIEAIKNFKDLKNYRRLYESYSHLANLQNDIAQYDRAIEYQKKAITFLDKIEDKKNFYSWSLNNLGYTYLLKGDYSISRNYLDQSLDANKSIDLKNYAIIIGNIAYCNLKMGEIEDVEKQLLESLSLRDSLNNKIGVVYTKLRLSEYYSYTMDTVKAINYALEARDLSKEIRNSGEYLNSLNQLATVDKPNSNNYLKEYIRFNDSLTNAERKTLNKFTRIEFETDEIIEKNEVLTQQRVWIFGASFGLILILSLLYFIRVQRVKNEKLFLETEQQKANEQVYLLTLKQQATLEEEKTKERNRISQELHDGILGRLFGTRVGLGFLDLNADEKTQEQHEAFLEELQDIEKEIREVSHKLNDNFASPDVNFTSIVTQLLESKSQIGDFQFHLNIDDNISWKSTDEIIKVNVYRIIQETLQNTIKHAQAKNVILEFSSSDQELSVKIEDDGVGFNLKKSRKGIGLKNMKSRVEKLNGTLEITSAMNKGTQIHIKIPIV